MTPAEAIRQAAEMLAEGDHAAASTVLTVAFAPLSPPTTRSAWPNSRLLRVFLRDGFTDRYSGQALVFPGALRAMSVLAPQLFPYHRNWKQGDTHHAYWSHYPTIDHVLPVARGGPDDESNVITTSMLRNAAKSNWLLSELGWPEHHAPLLRGWDGLLPWFCREYERKQVLQEQSALQAWYKAARSAA